jgi:YHS domain-containing protein
MLRRTLIVGAVWGLTVPALAQTDTATPFYNSDNQGRAARGYDVVAYFTQSKPVMGRAEFAYDWGGATWWFSNAANRALFAATPENYAPQFGGFCALAAAYEALADGDPLQWAIVDGRLYFNNNANAKARWDKDRPGYIAKANKNWPAVVKKGIGAKEQ